MIIRARFRFHGLISHQHHLPTFTAMCHQAMTSLLKLPPSATDGADSEPNAACAEVLQAALKALKAGQVIAVPTDTLYGLSCLAQNSEAVREVYRLKSRNGNKPLAICVAQVHDIYRYCEVVVQRELLEDLLPGPVTLVLRRLKTLNPDLNPFTELVGVRIPDHSFMRLLCRSCGEPLALTSANVSSQASTVDVSEFKELWPQLPLVVDGGRITDETRLGSTVVDLSEPGTYRIIRAGCALSETVSVLQQKFSLVDASSCG